MLLPIIYKNLIINTMVIPRKNYYITALFLYCVYSKICSYFIEYFTFCGAAASKSLLVHKKCNKISKKCFANIFEK